MVLPALTLEKNTVTIVSEPAANGAVAVISGDIPEGAVVTVEQVSLSKDDLISYLGEEKSDSIKEFIVYDIDIDVAGEKWEPNESVSVTIRKPTTSDMVIGQTAVEHIDSITGEAERIQTSTYDDDSISFLTDGFSLYVFYTFTVDYYFGGAEYHQDGLSSIYLSELLTALGIECSVYDVNDVVFSNSNLLNVRKDESGDWLLSSLEAFSSDETLILTLKDGEEIRIDTKDVAYTWFNLHNVIIGGNVGDKYYFTFDYYDENGIHQQYDRRLANYEEIHALKVALNTPVTITQIQGKYMDAGGTIHTDGVYDNYLQLGGDPQVRTNVFHVDNMTTVFQNVNVCFYEISSNGLGILNITKNAVNSSNPNQTYRFVVLYHATNYKMNAVEFDLRAGETKNILYYCDTQYGNNMEIFISEMSSFSNCDVSFTVNGGNAQIPQQENLYGRIHEDIGYKYDNYKFIKIPISGNYDTFNVVCNNTFVDRSVTIRKTAVQGEPNKSYTFTLNAYNALSQLVWQGSASVKSGNSSKVTIPVDCSYVIVQETNHAGYTVSMSGSGSNSGTDGRRIPKAQFPADVTFTNTREVVPITLTKELVCSDMAGAGPFHFEASVTNANGNPIDVSTITQPTGSGVMLKPGTSNVLQVSIGGFSSSVTEKSVQLNVPKGARITITEANPGSGYNVTNSLGGTNTAVINSAANGSSVKFTNTEAPSTVSMTVIKHLAGLQNGEFDFEMSVDSPSWPPSVTPADWPSGAVIGTDGVIRFTLTVTNGNEPQITIPGIPIGAEVTITEISHDGFNVKFTDNASAYVHVGYTDTYELNENKTVTVVNSAGTELPETGGIGVYPIYALGIVLIAGSIMYGFVLRRKRGRRSDQ